MKGINYSAIVFVGTLGPFDISVKAKDRGTAEKRIRRMSQEATFAHPESGEVYSDFRNPAPVRIEWVND